MWVFVAFVTLSVCLERLARTNPGHEIAMECAPTVVITGSRRGPSRPTSSMLAVRERTGHAVLP
jgi:hypothetical protein